MASFHNISRSGPSSHLQKTAESHLHALSPRTLSPRDSRSDTMLTITMKTLQQQTFKVHIDEELTVSVRGRGPVNTPVRGHGGLGNAAASAGCWYMRTVIGVTVKRYFVTCCCDRKMSLSNTRCYSNVLPCDVTENDTLWRRAVIVECYFVTGGFDA